MNVLLLTLDFPPQGGGIATFLQNLCLQLQLRGHDIEVLASSSPGDRGFDAQQPFPVRRYHPLRALSSMSPALLTFIRGYQWPPDVLLVGLATSTWGLGAHLLWRLRGVPYVVLVHGFDLVSCLTAPSVLDRVATGMLMRNASLILANSHYTRQLILANGFGPADRVAILNPGVDTQRFRPDVNAGEVVRRYELAGCKVLTTVGRLVERKNHENVLRALRHVVTIEPSVRYLIVGNGPEESNLRRIVNLLGLEGIVIFAGAVPENDLAAYYTASDAVVMPSKTVAGSFEGFGIVFVEAAACGKPVVGSRSGGITDAVIDGVTGILVDPDDVDEIARAVLRLLTDVDYARELGKNGRRRVDRDFSWQTVGSRVETSLNRAIDIDN